MSVHFTNRDNIRDVLERELLGPDPAGPEIDISNTEDTINDENQFGPFREKESGEEILVRDVPTKRYGIGVLYPFGSKEEERSDKHDSVGLNIVSDEGAITGPDAPEKEALIKNAAKIHDSIFNTKPGPNQDDFDLSTANSYKPSSIGVSFLAEFPEGAKLVVHASGGCYRKVNVTIKGFNRTWWVRSPVELEAEFSGQEVISGNRKKISTSDYTKRKIENLNLQIEVYSRPHEDQVEKRLLTVCLVNRTEENATEAILFQAHFKAWIESPNSQFHIMPYPRAPYEKLDEEEKSLELLYRNARTFAVGHGCAASWDIKATGEKVSFVTAECLPVFEAPSVTPDIKDEFDRLIRVPMAPLAGLIKSDDGLNTLESVINSYQYWISQKRADIDELEPEFQHVARGHLDECEHCAERMKQGLHFLKTNSLALRAFQLSNYAILLQQLHSRREARKLTFDNKTKRICFPENFIEPDPLKEYENKGYWRAFQIAFLLMAVASTADPESLERELVELIWFPTGGGKTEAYLGLAAFALFLRRLENKEDKGTHVLMRYTLRLLTAQQFQRASRLICAMEYIRRQSSKELGETPFSIGMWVGGGNTPNKRSQAVIVLRGLVNGDSHTQNMFVVDRCPWCGAQMGPVTEEGHSRRARGANKVYGYHQVKNTVVFKCPDSRCPFKDSLPVYVIDEDMYENPPSIIIGTVDKFAMLAWNPEARALFGIGKDGIRKNTPPGLIIQDELHLISGPLGSMVGLYETLIEELCTDRTKTQAIRPKIISSTATIRRYKDQIKALYARDKVALFPPPGIEDGDSFFARFAVEADGNLSSGRMYVGVNAPSLGSMQTVQVRVFTSLLQAPLYLPENERDPWWTLLIFFNSLRELGTTLSLIQSDIPDYQQVFVNRMDKATKSWRLFSEIKELTGRASSEDVPKAITALERVYPSQNPKPIDICLASNILEVGVDIDRLSLISVVGQPKTTSQYIQVTGRVGRSWWERPGLVVTIYSASKPRDRSHFEKFRSYHQRLYSQVEPTSVTPFSPPALDRALHAVMVAYVLQMSDENGVQSPHPYPSKLLEEIKAVLLPRVRAVDPQEEKNFLQVFEQKSREWKKWQPVKWTPSHSDADIALLRVAGAYATPEQEKQSWPTMQSMRSVDAECLAEILNPIVVEGEIQDAEQP